MSARSDHSGNPQMELLHDTSLFNLYLYRGCHVMVVKWPHIKPPMPWEVTHSFGQMKNFFLQHQVSRFLIDSRGSEMILNPTDQQEFGRHMVDLLHTTPLRKIARLTGKDQLREAQSAAIGSGLSHVPGIQLQLCSFGNFADAIDWLLQD